MPLDIGTILYHRYRIEEILGKGGMGAVYRAVDVNLGVHVAVKENYFITEEFARQFRREATILASLRQANLPRVTDHFVLKGQGQFLVMDYIEGQDLRQMVEENGPLAEQQVLPWFLEICDALTYLHTLTPPIIHRDIKPGNIKITPDGQAYLVDFGLAKVVDENVGTTLGAKAMTPGYSPPEQYGSGHTDHRTDVYSLAATMYATLTAVVPEESLERAMGRLALTPINKRNSAISSGMARAIEKAMQVRPVDRYQTVSDFAAAIRSIQGSGQATVISNLPFMSRDRTASDSTEKRAAKNPQKPKPLSRPAVQQVTSSPLKRRLPLYFIGAFTVLLVLYGAIYAIPGLNPRLASFFAPATNTDVVSDPFSTDTASPAVPEETEPVQMTENTGTQETSPDPATMQVNTGIPTESAEEVGGIGGGAGQIAFASNRSGEPQIYLISTNGSDEVQLTNLVDGACQPAWSPDGTQIVFTSPCNKSKTTYPGSSLWMIGVDGSGLSSLPTVAGGGDFDARFSPDGSRIAFTSMRDGRPQVYLMTLETKEVQNISDNLTTENQPAWHPEGNALVYNSWRAGFSELFMVELPDLEEKRYTLSDEPDASHADFSGDGQQLLFQRLVGGIPRLFVNEYNSRDRLARQVCSESPLAAYPMSEARWSLDGKWIAFETWPEGAHQIALITDSCGQYQILTGESGAYDFDPAWRP
ncbi:MAG: serine/threonine-protein kinase [Anaerolineales bacterium]|nr:serine/threonine-protein kinase [Anaerolineales bacterium]